MPTGFSVRIAKHLEEHRFQSDLWVLYSPQGDTTATWLEMAIESGSISELDNRQKRKNS
ncbi:10625_t:CDS:2 [Diversispora eburnea]|uniref:10625_t:CDS:1 n=1 Tax=Diversispora eburnea TaxID=1213867 RepID=A0A9N8W7J8_9GLOM|nr:10625_t:CDS:2 [Diversispora eburnea]